jgi:hypothetical protein
MIVMIVVMAPLLLMLRPPAASAPADEPIEPVH